MKVLIALLLALIALPAWAQGTSTTVVWLPTRPTAGLTTAWPATDALRCTAVVPELTISATQMAWYVTGGLGGGGLCSMTLYTGDGTSQIITSGAKDCSATGTVVATGLTSATITAGTKYQLCTCANSNGGGYAAASSVSSAVTTLQNFLSVPIGASAANGCTAAVPPASTGTLTAAAVNTPIVLLAVTGF